MKSIEDAIAVFEKNAAIQAETFETGDYKKGNKCFKRLMQSIVYLHSHNQLNVLEQFLHHSDVGVRSSAAYALLPIMEAASVSVLQEIALNDYGINSLNAKMTIERWKDNEIIFPYQEGFHW